MKWSAKLGEFSGIGVYIHATFLIVIASVAFAHWQAGHTAGTALTGIFFVLAIFACVLLHEFGHALMAKRFGIKTRDITLLTIGGVVRLERMPRDPRQERWVALASPAVNVVISDRPVSSAGLDKNVDFRRESHSDKRIFCRATHDSERASRGL
jgi:Zn-dependent protease